jgi:hypothetical protein
MMKPIGIRRRAGELQIVQECERCGHRRPNRISERDDEEAIRAVSCFPFTER